MFKKVYSTILVLFLAMSLSAFAQEWHTTNQVTVTWDAVTALNNDAAIPETDIIEYRVYLVNAVTDPGKTNPVVIGITGDTSYVITLVDEGQYFVGLQTVRKILTGTEGKHVVSKSVIGWTDDSAIVLDGKTFGVRYFLPPKVVTGARVGT